MVLQDPCVTGEITVKCPWDATDTVLKGTFTISGIYKKLSLVDDKLTNHKTLVRNMESLGSMKR